jgi:hypothetical protein
MPVVGFDLMLSIRRTDHLFEYVTLVQIEKENPKSPKSQCHSDSHLAVFIVKKEPEF